ncbi:hypothetical protein MRX96_031600 [Rhipicephalus microplus]
MGVPLRAWFTTSPKIHTPNLNLVGKVEPDIKKTAPDIRATELSDTAQEKPVESKEAEKLELAIQRADEPASEKQPAISEELQQVTPEIERPPDETLWDAVPEVELKKPTQHEGVKEFQAEIEGSTQESPVSAGPEVESKKPTQLEVEEKLEQKVEISN